MCVSAKSLNLEEAVVQEAVGKNLKKKKKKQWETSIDRKDIAKKNLR